MGVRDRKRLAVPALLFVLFSFALCRPVDSYDLFWHLATGRWIVEHRQLPLSDPFALASDRTEWVNGEWLFQVGAYAAERVAGVDAFHWLRGLLGGALFTLVYAAARRRAESQLALIATAIAMAGAAPLLDLRPSGVAAFFVVTAIVTRNRVGWLLLTAFWINTHPSALLAPFIAGLHDAEEARNAGNARVLVRRPPRLLVAVAGLLINPYGIEAVLAPLRLMRWVGSGVFVNAEWAPSSPIRHPVLYLTIAASFALFAWARRREEWWRFVLFCALAWLAASHVRHQPLYFASLPLLIAPLLRFPVRPLLAWGASAIAIASVASAASFSGGVAPDRFPIIAVARLELTRLPGNVYNADQFGGYLIWRSYPARRTLIDGRNELFRQFIPHYLAAQTDERQWRRMLREHRIDLALDEYRKPATVIDAASGAKSVMAASLAYWPRDEWALIGYDRVAMLFARRKAFDETALQRWEIRGPRPDEIPAD